MKTAKIFDKSNLKCEPELQAEIIRRFNNYELLIRVMETAARNIRTTVRTSPEMRQFDKDDLFFIARLLDNATKKEWQKNNIHFY